MAALAEASSEQEIDNFKDVYKRFKRRDRPLNVRDVIDFSNGNNVSSENVDQVDLQIPEEAADFPGLKPLKQWKAYQLKNKKGFIVIPNPFLAGYQRYWVQRCLLDFPTKPNTTNIDAHSERPAQIWHASLSQDRADLGKESLLMRLRWATLGYQYEWNTKEYFSDRVQVFPDDLSALCRYVAAALGYARYSCEAGIVNFYRMASTLMGHTDVSELDKAAPLISFSFGQSCIFLIGGPTKAEEPVPVFLHSGDICLMTGPARLSYHAVPRIVPARPDYLAACLHTNKLHSDTDTATEITQNGGDHVETTVTQDTDKEDDPYAALSKQEQIKVAFDKLHDSKAESEEPLIVTPTVKGDKCTIAELQQLMESVIKDEQWRPFEPYINVSRINVNVRQVLKEGMSLNPRPEKILTCQRNNNTST